jgi:hypothetical protein
MESVIGNLPRENITDGAEPTPPWPEQLATHGANATDINVKLPSAFAIESTQ